MKKKVIAISLSTLLIFLTIGGIFAVSSNADSIVSTVLVPVISSGDDLPSVDTLKSEGLYLGKIGTYNSYCFTKQSNYPVKVAFIYNNTHTYCTVFVCSTTNNVQFFYPALQWGDELYKQNYTLSTNVLIGNNFAYGYSNSYTFKLDSLNPNIPIFDSVSDAALALNNGIWEDEPPVDPGFQFDIDLGALKNVTWKQISVPSTNESIVEIQYDQYTTTGINLMNSGMGVGVRYLAYNSVDNENPFYVSEPIWVQNYTYVKMAAKWLKLNLDPVLGPALDEFVDLLNVIDTAEHSFNTPQNNGVTINDTIYHFDAVLFPYYYDGTDYYFGYQTTIKDIYFDYIGTRLIPTENEFTDTETYMNSAQSNTYYYDYGIEADYIDNSYNVYYYTTNQFFNYTAVTDDPTEVEFNDIDNSTKNVYNFVGVGSMPDLDIDGLNLNPSQVIDTVKGVITALIVASPLLMGLFDFLPYWAISLSIACCIAVAVICVIRIFKVGG